MSFCIFVGFIAFDSLMRPICVLLIDGMDDFELFLNEKIIVT